ncbi:MAG: polysaccharide deacetylase family protein [Bacillota bacterium]|jgi:hypothetical protein
MLEVEKPSRRRRKRKSSGLSGLALSCSLVLALLLVFNKVGWPHVLGSFVERESDLGSVDGAHLDGSGEEEVNGIEPQDPDEDQLALLKPNELGKVMIIMYHDVQEKESEWVRSRENFRKDLERFYELGYSLIPLNSYLSGVINVPAGRAPLILTFDDGTPGQLKTIERDGVTVPDPDCAVGILMEFSKEHPEFGHAATFYVDYPTPFGDPYRIKENLDFLIENGMEIGNHTYSHRNLQGVSPDVVAEEIGRLANKIKEISRYETKSLALPYGGYPPSKENLGSGQWDGQDYVNLGVLLVGAEAAPSPFSSKFNPMAIPRIRGSSEELDKWLTYFQEYPERRFVSDGQAGVVTIPREDDAQPAHRQSVEGQSDLPHPDLDLARVGDRRVETYRLPDSETETKTH